MVSKSDFLIAYGKVVAHSWDDKAYRDRLFAEPHAVLNEAGLTISDGIKIEVAEFAPAGASGASENGGPDAMYGAWAKAAETGTYTLPVPTAPAEASDMVLYDEELEGVAGGGDVCCCPCCCCC
jgi:hypothetical protein